ncbi:MAG: transcriptional regulatory protein zraR [Verrucomicrobiota bacterium]
MSIAKGNNRVLLVEADDSIQRIVAYHLKKAGFEAEFAETGDAAIAQSQNTPICAVIDLMIPGTSGMSVLKHFREHLPQVPVIAMAGRGEAMDGLTAIRAGAFDYVTKPLDVGAFVATVSAAVRTGHSLNQPVGQFPGLRDTQWIGQSPSARILRETASALGATQADVLITGPEGGGKRLFARMLHHVSARSRGPLVPVNCASIPGELLEEELFGKSAGTVSGGGQETRRTGRVQMAEGGTLLLLEVGETPLAQQSLILELLQNRWIHRRDTGTSVPVNVRVIATSRTDLRAKVAAKEFREDLFYRLNALTVEIPSLQERIEDLPFLSGIFLQRLSMVRSGVIPQISNAASALLTNYSWPGNVRELESVLEWAYFNSVGGEIRVADLPPRLHRPSDPTRILQGGMVVPYVGGMSMEAVEKLAVQQTLDLCHGNKAAAARILDVTEKTIYNKLARLGLKDGLSDVPSSGRKRGRKPGKKLV